jgi:hypothetical protein
VQAPYSSFAQAPSSDLEGALRGLGKPSYPALQRSHHAISFHRMITAASRVTPNDNSQTDSPGAIHRQTARKPCKLGYAGAQLPWGYLSVMFIPLADRLNFNPPDCECTLMTTPLSFLR